MKVIGPRFILRGFEPAEVRTAPVAQRRAYWEAVSAFVAEAKEDELKRGLDRKGEDMTAIAASTRRNRHSEMGPADPFAPPLQPAHGLSRTRALFTAQPTRMADGVTCFWAYDPHTGASWGEILRHHRAGGPHLPVRDVIGLSPTSLETVRTRALHWWRSYIHGVSEIPTPTRELMPTPPPKFLVQREPANAPPFAAKRVSQIRVNEKTYTFQSGSAAQVRDAIAGGKFSGFHTAAEVKELMRESGVSVDPITGRTRFTFGPRPPPAPPPKPAPIPPKPTPLPHAGTTGPGPAFGPSPARVLVDPDRAEETGAVLARLLGEGAVPRDAATLAGAPEGTTASLLVAGYRDDAITVIVNGPGVSITRQIRRNPDGVLMIENISLFVDKSGQGRGLGTEILGRQIEAARAAGVEYLYTAAAGSPADPGTVGYKVWPKFGYDGPLRDQVRWRLPGSLKDARRISDLYATPEGRKWWEENGEGIGLRFDLAPGSYSSRVWEAYLRERRAARGKP